MVRVGVNVAGYFDSPLGVGEAARQVRSALEAAGTPTAAITLPERRTRGSRPDPAPTPPPYDITLLCVVAAPEGVAAVEAAAPQVTLYTATIDDGLNEVAYIVPGLGDAGDRQFGPR